MKLARLSWQPARDFTHPFPLPAQPDCPIRKEKERKKAANEPIAHRPSGTHSPTCRWGMALQIQKKHRDLVKDLKMPAGASVMKALKPKATK